jgi:hypothetical protein
MFLATEKYRMSAVCTFGSLQDAKAFFWNTEVFQLEIYYLFGA